MTIINDKYELCEHCDGEGSYWYDSGIFYSYKDVTHKYLAECEDCNGTGKIYEDEDEEEEEEEQ